MVDQLSATQPTSAQDEKKEPDSADKDTRIAGEWELVLTYYNSDSSNEKKISDTTQLKEELANARRGDHVVWLDVIGKPPRETIDEIMTQFEFRHFDPLALVRTHQRSKFELYEEQVALVVWSIDKNSGLHPHQTVMMPGKKCMLTLQPDARDLFRDVREKLKKGLNKSRRGGTDYLTYTLLDDVVDSYFPCLERYGERLETIEDQIVDNPSRRSISQIHTIKRDLLDVRRHIWALREAVNATIRDDSEFFEEGTKNHLRDVYEHVVQLIDFVEIYRELCADLMDVYLSSISNRMNEVMKVLTIITTVFVPPGLIAGIYGMNFKTDGLPFNMPELSWKYGYYWALGLMFLSACTTLVFFWIQGWLGDGPRFIRLIRHKLHHRAPNHRDIHK